jgi:hypothetical protein
MDAWTETRGERVWCRSGADDALGSATRTTQRYGRTGRKHDGRVVTLMTEGYEESVHERGLERYQKMRKAIRNPGSHLQLWCALAARRPLRAAAHASSASLHSPLSAVGLCLPLLTHACGCAHASTPVGSVC